MTQRNIFLIDGATGSELDRRDVDISMPLWSARAIIDAPEILKKEFDNLKESIIEEASRMEKAENIQENESTNTYQDSKITKALNEIKGINEQIDLFNKTINNKIK